MAHLLVVQREGYENISLAGSPFETWDTTFQPVLPAAPPFMEELLLLVLERNVDAVLVVTMGLEGWIASVSSTSWFDLGVPVHHLSGTTVKTYTPLNVIPASLRAELEAVFALHQSSLIKGKDHSFMHLTDLPTDVAEKLRKYLPSN